jgi:FkbM family methyltransferase
MADSVSREVLERPFADMQTMLRFLRHRGFEPGFVVDVGANRGHWTEMLKEIFPAAEVLLIEPQVEMREPLDQLCARLPGLRWVETAVGAREETRLQTIWEDLSGSSFLPRPDPERMALGEQRPARVCRLDDLLRDAGSPAPDLVKLDVQGFELEVLRGCPSIFGKTEVFVLETSLYAFLDDIPLLREVIAFMAEREYEVYDLAGQFRRPVDGALGQLDVVFAKRRGFLRQHDLW